MRIAIQASDLDHQRIDGTRVYILNVLRHLGKLAPDDQFFLYHRRDFNPALAPPNYPNYVERRSDSLGLWTQTRFAQMLFKDRPDVLWMPMHNLPLVRPPKLKTVVTIHDLAFKYFPEAFPLADRLKLNFLAGLAINQADRIIAVSQSTKNDILKFYPAITEENVKVIHHGFDAELFQKEISEEEKEKILKSYKLKATSYLLYVGAIQPRKNLPVLVEAFEKTAGKFPDLKLVIAGAKAWQWEGTMERIEKSAARDRIVLTGGIPFADLAALYQGARVFVFPSLYEGFGIPILEAMASGVPVVAARNSSLLEAGGEAAQYFKSGSSDDLAAVLGEVVKNDSLCQKMIESGKAHIQKFSWEKCARETLGWIRGAK